MSNTTFELARVYHDARLAEAEQGRLARRAVAARRLQRRAARLSRKAERVSRRADRAATQARHFVARAV